MQMLEVVLYILAGIGIGYGYACRQHRIEAEKEIAEMVRTEGAGETSVVRHHPYTGPDGKEEISIAAGTTVDGSSEDGAACPFEGMSLKEIEIDFGDINAVEKKNKAYVKEHSVKKIKLTHTREEPMRFDCCIPRRQIIAEAVSVQDLGSVTLWNRIAYLFTGSYKYLQNNRR